MIKSANRFFQRIFGKSDKEYKQEAIDNTIYNISVSDRYPNVGCSTYMSDIHPNFIPHPEDHNIGHYELGYIPLVDVSFQLEKRRYNGKEWRVNWVDGYVITEDGTKEKISLGYSSDLDTLATYFGTSDVDSWEGNRVPVVREKIGNEITMCMYELGMIEKELEGKKKPQNKIVADIE